jgi:hypothetical protein
MGETTIRFFSSISRIFNGVNSFIFSRLVSRVLRHHCSMPGAALSLGMSGPDPKWNTILSIHCAVPRNFHSKKSNVLGHTLAV